MRVTKNLKKIKLFEQLDQIVKHNKYFAAATVDNLNTDQINRFKNKAKKLGFQAVKLRPNFWNKILKEHHLGQHNETGGDLLLVASTVKEPLLQLIQRTKIQHLKYLKTNQLAPQDITIPAGLTKLKAGPYMQIFEKLTTVKIQKTCLFLEKDITLKAKELVSPELADALRILQMKLNSSLFKVSYFFEKSAAGLKPLSVPFLNKLNNPSLSQKELTAVLHWMKQTLVPTGPTFMPHRINNIVSLLINNISARQNHSNE